MPGASSNTGSVQDSNNQALLTAINALVQSIDSKVVAPAKEYNKHEVLQVLDEKPVTVDAESCHSITLMVYTGRVNIEIIDGNGDLTEMRFEEGMSITFQATSTLEDTFVFTATSAGGSYFLTKRLK